MSKLRKTKNNKLILVLPMVLVICFAVLLTYSFANFKSIKLFDAVGGFFLGNEYTLSYDVANCTNKTIKNGKTFGELCEPAIPDGYTFDGWYYNNELIESTTQVHTNQNIQLLAHFTQNNPCVIGTTYDFDYTGDVQQFTAQCPGQYKVELWGASGGTAVSNAEGGKGAYTSGTIKLITNNKLYIYVGEAGEGIHSPSGSVTKSPYNGGGLCDGAGDNNSYANYYGASGGGATDVRYFETTTPSDNDLVWNSNIGLNSRIMVAAGGGGGYSYSNLHFGGKGGAGGGLNGYQSSNGAQVNGSVVYQPGYGGSQTSGGSYDGVFGKAGDGTVHTGIPNANYSGASGGGGGGYYGGGAGTHVSGGGSGSSYISGHAGSIAIAEGATNNPRTIKSGCTSSSTSVDCSKHYSGLYFTDTVMIDGSGYNWTTTKGSLVNQPQPDGTTATGHSGNGYARITYLGNVTEFAYTGDVQTFIAPFPGQYKLEVWGAQGGGSNGGKGGYSSGNIVLSGSDTLYIVVGGAGSSSTGGVAGGYNGGGRNRTEDGNNSGSGGGATHIAKVTDELKNIGYDSFVTEGNGLIVAGGGGGNTKWHSGGVGGGLSGGTGSQTGATAGTQTSGSVFGLGGNATTNTSGGGGGGLYGGTGGGINGTGGAGGSGYIGGVTNGQTIAGNAAMPKHDGTTGTMTGNTGNGYARITYLGNAYSEPLLNGADPVLTDNLVPVNIFGDGTVKKANIASKWYKYEDKEWANAVVLKDKTISYGNNEIIPESNIQSYFVWIPKYSYQLWDLGNYNSLSSNSDKLHSISIRFGTNDTTNSVSGECQTPRTSGASGSCTVGDYMTHPAFIAMNSNGLWVGKFETGYDGATSSAGAQVNSSAPNKVTIKPNVYSWRSITGGNMFTTAYNYLRNDESHMMKNTEWGAVAYLQHSEYGSSSQIALNANASYVTGYNGTENTYNSSNGYLSSTTGNITGIYDFSGCSSELVMGYIQNNVGSSGFAASSYNSKYYDLYSTSSSNYSYNYRILGDATGEMGPFTSAGSSWYNEYGIFVRSNDSWFVRGLNYSSTRSSGMFAFSNYNGRATDDVSFRIVLAP